MTDIDTEMALVTYCLLELIQPIMRGTPRRVASQRSWALLQNSTLMLMAGVVVPADHRHSTRCVAVFCKDILAVGLTPNMRKPRMAVPASVPTDCIVAVHLVQRVMLGEHPGDALRNAIDAEAGRSSRRRASLPDAEVFAFTSALQEKLKWSLNKVRAL